jgi:D-alanyl-D-alanine carboxypeptidase
MKFVFHKPYPIAADEELSAVPAELTRHPGRVYRARPEAIAAFEKMAAAASSDRIHLVVISAHRRADEQAALFADAERRHGRGKGILWVAPSGYSEHHTGYVLDLADRDHPETDDEPGFEDTPAGEWLARRAPEFGFELSFPVGNWQNVGYEPWHWRFAGDDRSRKLFHPCAVRSVLVLIRAAANGFFRRITL